MRTLQIHLPDNLDLSDQEASTALAAQLYEMGKLSLGQAAELAGYSKASGGLRRALLCRRRFYPARSR